MSDTVRLEDLPDDQWERVADYVSRVAYLATLQAYWAGANDESPTDGDEQVFAKAERRAEDYTRSGFDANTVKEFCLTSVGRLPEDEGE